MMGWRRIFGIRRFAREFLLGGSRCVVDAASRQCGRRVSTSAAIYALVRKQRGHQAEMTWVKARSAPTWLFLDTDVQLESDSRT